MSKSCIMSPLYHRDLDISNIALLRWQLMYIQSALNEKLSKSFLDSIQLTPGPQPDHM